MHRGNHGGGATPWAHTTRHVERVHEDDFGNRQRHAHDRDSLCSYECTSGFTPAHLFSVDERHGARLRMFAC